MIAAGAFAGSWLGAAGSAVVAGAINGAIIGAAVGAVKAASSGTSITDGMAQGALTGAATGAVMGGISQAFTNTGGLEVAPNTDVSQVGVNQTAQGEIISADTMAQQGMSVEGGGTGVMDVATGQVTPVSPAAPAAPAGAAPTTGTAASTGTTTGVTDNQYLLAIEKMGDASFKREAVSGAVQAGMGAYASKEEAKAKAESDQAVIDAAKPAGVLRRDYAAPVVSPEYAANRPTVVAPTAARPTAVQVGVERPTADIRNISVQKGVLPNG